MSISSRAQARSKSFCDSPNSFPRKTRITPCVIDNVDFAFAEAERGLERFNQARTIFLSDRDPVLDDLDPRAESFDLFGIVIHAHDFVVDPNAEITLLLKKLEKFSRLGFRGNRYPKRDQNIFIGAIAQYFVGDRLCRLRSNLAAAAWTKCFRDPRPKQF